MKRKRIISCLTAVFLISGMAVSGAVIAAPTDWLAESFNLRVLDFRGDLARNNRLDADDYTACCDFLFGKYKKYYDPYVYDVNSDGAENIADLITLKASLTGDSRIWNAYNIPVMDGSTSAIPLEAGFKAKMLGIPYTTAKNSVNHNKTHISFQKFLNGECDLIFTVPISESQQKDADDAGVHLNLAPVAKEGFVFVVSKDNPVDSLTEQQIKDIYSGKITNWSEVGGDDVEIIAYQRNNDSGSQNYMNEFMKDSELMVPPTEHMIGTMGGIMDAVTAYSNSSQAIGYSVYSYAAQMYENSSDVKFIAVNGIKPSKESMADETYPLLSNTYIMYRDDASDETLDFINWAVSEEGQQCVLENGYIPVENMEYPERYRPYTEKGTGMEKESDYISDDQRSELNIVLRSSKNKDKDLKTFRIDFIKDKELQETVNNDLKAILDAAPDDLTISIYVVNGYMSVTVKSNETVYSRPYDNDVHVPASAFYAYNYSETLNYDLIRGKKIENFSDLFYKDVNIAQIVDDGIVRNIKKISPMAVRTDFLGITGGMDKFTVNTLFAGKDNPYFTDNFELSFSSDDLHDYMVTGKYYDMRGIIEDTNIYNLFECSYKYSI